MLRWLGLAAAALAVGAALGLVHGNGGMLRTEIGNLSAPWLLIALVPAWWAGSWWRGALVGLAATMLALLGFYVAMTVVLHGHFGGASGWPAELRYDVRVNRIWFEAGLLSGPVLGTVGGALGPARRWRLAILAGALMLGELLVMRLVAGVRLPVAAMSFAVERWTAYDGQAVIGLLLLLGGLAARRSRPGA